MAKFFDLEGILRVRDKSKTGLKSAERGIDGLGKQVKKIGLAMGVVFGANMVADMAKLGAQAGRVEHRFNALAKGLGGAEFMMEAFQKGAGGTVDKMTAMQSASKLMMMGLAETGDEMSTIVELATRLGDQTAGAGSRVEDFALMLANTSIPRLDNFGISSGIVRTRMKELQEQMGKTREEAFKMAVFEQGAKTLGVLGERVKDDLYQFEMMEKKLADLKIELGQRLAPVMADFVGFLTEVLDIAIPLIDVLGEVAGEIKNIAERALEAVGIDLPGWMKDVGTTASKIQQLADAEELVEKYTAGWSASLDELRVKGGSTTDVVLQMVGAFRNTHTAMDEAGWTLDWYGKQTDILIAVAQKAHGEMVVGAETWEEYIFQVDLWNSLVGDSVGALQGMGKALWKQTRGISDSTEAIDESINRMHTLSGTYAKVARHMFEVKDKAGDMQEQIAKPIPGVDLSFLDQMEAKLGEVAGYSIEIKAKEAEGVQRSIELNRIWRDEQIANIQAANSTMIEYIGSMQDATEETFKQQVLAELSKTDIGWQAYADVGQELGLLTGKQVLAAEAVYTIIEAYEKHELPASNVAKATEAMWKEVDSLNPKFEEELQKPSNSGGSWSGHNDCRGMERTIAYNRGRSVTTG